MGDARASGVLGPSVLPLWPSWVSVPQTLWSQVLVHLPKRVNWNSTISSVVILPFAERFKWIDFHEVFMFSFWQFSSSHPVAKSSFMAYSPHHALTSETTACFSNLIYLHNGESITTSLGKWSSRWCLHQHIQEFTFSLLVHIQKRIS